MITVSTVPIRQRVRSTIVVLALSMFLGGSVLASGDVLETAPIERIAPVAAPSVGSPIAPSAASSASAYVPATPELEAEVVAAAPVSDSGLEQAVRVTPRPVIDPFGPIMSPDVGDYCAASLDAVDISEFFSKPIGSFQGADYQRAFRLADDRVLWTFQDAFISGTLVHNVGMVQSGRCFTILNSGARSWLLGELTSHMSQWQWIFDGGMNTDGSEFHLFVVQMNETGGSYLNKPRPTAMRRIVLDVTNFQVIDVIEEQATGPDLYGWGVTNDEDFTYLYSHCYQQFGYDTLMGSGECSVNVKLARVPLGDFAAAREYWDGGGWSASYAEAAAVVDANFVFSGNNPAQIRFDGNRFVLVEKRDDWFGKTVEFGVADNPQGPFVNVASIDEPLKCDRSKCNTYFASWIPWTDSSGDFIWSIGHNRWNGAETLSHIATYRPTFATINI